jgi:hypothetical protein
MKTTIQLALKSAITTCDLIIRTFENTKALQFSMDGLADIFFDMSTDVEGDISVKLAKIATDMQESMYIQQSDYVEFITNLRAYIYRVQPNP